MSIRSRATPTSGGRGLLALAVDRPVAVTMIVLAVAVFGFVSLQKLPQTLLPRISYPSLTVRTEFEGAAPSEVEELVTKVLESNLAVLGSLESYRSVSRAGVSDIVLEFEWDTNMSFAAQDVREKVDQVRSFLPREVGKPLLLKYDPTLDPILRFGLYGGDLVKLRFLAEERLEKRLESIGGVAAVRVRGGFESEIRVDLDENELRRAGITSAEIRQRLAEENVNLASGLLREGDVEYLVRTLNEFRSVDEIADLVVTARGDQLVRLRDVARVRLAAKEADVITRIDGRPSVELAVFKEDAANVVEVADAVKKALFGLDWRTTVIDGELDLERQKDLRERRRKDERQSDEAKKRAQVGEDVSSLVETLPRGVGLRLLSDQSRFIENSIAEVRQTGVWGAVFAVLVLLLFLRRAAATLIIAVSIPVSVVATFGPMMQFGVSLNIMSLGGLALGIGMLVDASIVVLESIERCRSEGDGLRRAALRGTREVGGAVVASVLTTVAVFLPIVFVEGVAGEIFKDQSLTVVFSLLTSLVVALFFIPMLAARRFNAEPGAEAKGSGETFRARLTLARRTLWPQRSLVRRSFDAWRGLRAGRLGALGPILSAPAVLPFLLVQGLLELAGRLLQTLLLVLAAFGALAFGAIHAVVTAALRPLARGFDFVYDGFERGYSALIRGALRARFLVVVFALLALGSAGFLLDRIGMELIPALHGGELVVEVPQPVGTSLETTSARTAVVESRIEDLRREGAIRVLGFSSAAGLARDEIAPAGEGPHTARVYLSLPIVDDMAGQERQVSDVVREDLRRLATVGELTFTSPKLFSFQNPLEVQIVGEDLAAIEALGRRLETRMLALESLSDVRSTVREGSPEFVIVYDRVQLAERGLELGTVAQTLRDKIKGVVPTKFSVKEQGRKIDILLKIPEESVAGLDALRDVVVGAVDGVPVRLGEVAEVSQGRGPSEVRRVGGERAVLITAAPRDVDLETAAANVGREVDAMRAARPELFRGIVVRVAGQSAEARRSRDEMLFALALALVLVYIVMASQFESLLDPLVIMFSSAFAAVGAVYALAFTGIAASVVVFIGGIMLAGIVVNNAIVLVDNVNRLHRSGMARREAIVAGARMRLRPILMTTATTVLGLVPMALSTGEGAEMRVPMAVTVIAGLASSTVLTLVIIPVVYSLAHGAVDGVAAALGRGGRTREEAS